MIHFKILLSACCNKDYSTLFTPLLHCLLIYYTCDVNICVENGSWHTYAMHSVLPPEPGVALSKFSECMIASLDNEQPVVPECVVEDLPEQQPGEGKCPLTHYVLHNL
jgi:hypothetical protein